MANQMETHIVRYSAPSEVVSQHRPHAEREEYIETIMPMRRPMQSRTRLRCSYTLVEILVATALSLLLLGAVVRMFGEMGQGITDSRAMLEAADQLRLAATRLQQDLAGVTVTMNPPRRPEDNEGYFEYVEGPVTEATAQTYARDTNNNDAQDTTVGDFDDILMFTTRSMGRPFVGRNNGNAVQSDVAEVAWFLRGRTLHRRVLLVAPSATGFATAPAGFYNLCDLSAHNNGGTMVLNTLSDLTRRENRFAHVATAALTFPYDVTLWQWRWGNGATSVYFPTLPTLAETSSTSWTAGTMVAPTGASIPYLYDAASNPNGYVDFWTNVTTYRESDTAMATPLGIAAGARTTDDIILTNVIGFDVKAWDPTAGGYVDLGYNNTPCTAALKNGLSHWGHRKSHLNATANTGIRVYDTWSTHYEATGTGLAGDLAAGNGINGFDDAGIDDSGTATVANGIVDSEDEAVTSPPYPIPLRGVQVKIRVFEPDSRQIREVTVKQDFLPQ